MSVLICGSLAFDTITNFPGRFAQQILPDQVHILNVSFLVPTLRREFGGCAGNIAYTLKLLGGTPLVMAALGNDGGEYLNRLQGWGLDTSLLAPALELSLNDAQGALIARRVLQGAELGLSATVVGAGQELPLLVMLATRERRIAGYNVELFYP